MGSINGIQMALWCPFGHFCNFYVIHAVTTTNPPHYSTQIQYCSVKHYNQSIKVFHHFNMYKKSAYCKILRPLSGQWNVDIRDVAFHHALIFMLPC